MKQEYIQNLKVEVIIYLKVIVGVPIIHWSGVEGDLKVMVMDLLGQSLGDLLEKSEKQFESPLSPFIVLPLADQIVFYIITEALTNRICSS